MQNTIPGQAERTGAGYGLVLLSRDRTAERLNRNTQKNSCTVGGETPVPPLILSLIPRAQPGESSLCLPILSPAFSEQFLNDGARDVR